MGRQNTSRAPATAGRQANGRAMKCYNCGGLNHAAANCTAPPKASSPKTCYNCGGEHLIRDCPNPKEERPAKSCYTCGGGDHLARNCPEGGSDQRPAKTCYSCGALGHIASACTSEPLAPAA